VLFFAPPPVVAEALVPAQAVACDGSVVSRIEFRSYKPSQQTAAERAAAATTDAVGLEHQHTRAFVLRAYLRFQEGDPCTEQGRVESERLLRAQRFISSASVQTFPDGEGRVRVRVSVVDELPFVGSARLRGLTPSAGTIGTMNYGGRGITAVVGAEYEPGYRAGGRVLVGQSGAFGRPALADAEWQRRTLGSLWRVGYAEPFLTDGQSSALHVSILRETSYPTLLRRGEEDVVVRTQRAAYNAGWVRRVRGGASGRLVGLGGVMVMGTEIRPDDALTIRSDTGLVATGDTSLVGRYRPHANGRVAVIAGVRFLRFKTVQRYETLRAEQDIASGVELDALVGPSINQSAGARDLLIATDLYLGAAGATSFTTFKIRAEGRITGRDERWEGIVGSALFSWFKLTSPTRTRTLSLSGAVAQNLSFPAQLSFRDHEGGLLAFPDGGEGGAARAVLRVEERLLLPWLSRRAGLATAWVADAGRIWKGDAPFGTTTPLRGSLGISLLGSYPVTSKRLYRVDLAVPVNRGPGDAKFVIRFLSGDRTGTFWAEPADVTRARASAGPNSLIRW
jgi:hypothetical protein